MMKIYFASNGKSDKAIFSLESTFEIGEKVVVADDKCGFIIGQIEASFSQNLFKYLRILLFSARRKWMIATAPMARTP